MENKNTNTTNTNHKKRKKKKKRVPNYPRIIAWTLPVVLVICVLAIIIRVLIWDKGVAYIITDEDRENIKLDTNDNLIIMPPSKIAKDTYDGTTDILIFGNDSFYAGRNDGSGIIDYFGKDLDNVNIIDCCLPGSYLNSLNETEKSPSESPEDYFSLFWLTFSTNWHDFSKQTEALLYMDPAKYDLDRYQEVISTLETVDYNNIDVVMFCYDGHDYAAGHLPVNFVGEDAQTENITTLLGALYVSVYVINGVNPDTQYVYVSPSFCYVMDENGEKISCNIANTGNGTIEETFNAARLISNYYGVSYVDLYSGVLINEENGEKYMEADGITPNKEARKMIADRLVTLLKDRL